MARAFGPNEPHSASLSAALRIRSSSSSSKGNVGRWVTFGGFSAVAGLASIQQESLQNRRKPRRYSRRLTAERAEYGQPLRNVRSVETSRCFSRLMPLR